MGGSGVGLLSMVKRPNQPSYSTTRWLGPFLYSGLARRVAVAFGKSPKDA